MTAVQWNIGTSASQNLVNLHVIFLMCINSLSH